MADDAPFYEESEDSEEEEEEEDSDEGESGEEGEGKPKKKKKKKKPKKKKPYTMDSDHRLLLRNAKPLLQSRNAAVSPSLSFRESHDLCNGHMTVT